MNKKKQKTIGDKLLIGRHEWCALEQLHIPFIKGKVDTGAATSAIHAFNIQAVTERRKLFALFDVHPLQGNTDIVVHCKAPIIDERVIMSSNGQKETRYIIQTQLKLNQHTWKIEVSLSNRDPLKYRFLLGRQALRNRVLIDPDHTNFQKRVTKKDILRAYYH